MLPLHDWCVRHAAQVAACYLPLPAGHLQAYIVTTSSRFDFGLAEDIAALERDLASAGWRVGLFQLPKAEDRSLATFFNPEGALEVYAQRRRHRSKAERNRNFLNAISLDDFPEWVVVASISTLPST